MNFHCTFADNEPDKQYSRYVIPGRADIDFILPIELQVIIYRKAFSERSPTVLLASQNGKGRDGVLEIVSHHLFELRIMWLVGANACTKVYGRTFEPVISDKFNCCIHTSNAFNAAMSALLLGLTSIEDYRDFFQTTWVLVV
jgi:hypothetical protein